MSFINKSFELKEELYAFSFCMRYLDMSMGKAQRFIAKRRLLNNGIIVASPNQLIKGEVTATMFEPNTQNLTPIFVHEDFAIFEKPSFVYSMPKGRDTEYSIVDEARYHFGDGANITHRLDYETSGLMIISRNLSAEKKIKEMFEKKEIKKKYHALIKGRLQKELTLDIPLEKNIDYEFSKHKTKVSPAGKIAITHIKPIEYFSETNRTYVELTPTTGRTHQLRVHLFHIFHPIVGDPLYGTSFEFASNYLDNKLNLQQRVDTILAPRLMLNASYLEFNYEGENFQFSSSNFLDQIKEINDAQH